MNTRLSQTTRNQLNEHSKRCNPCPHPLYSVATLTSDLLDHNQYPH